MRPSEVEYHVTIVVRSAVSKIDALAILALALGTHVQGQGTARPFVGLAKDAWAEIEIPKFGEPPPLAIDVYSRLSDDHARLQALALMGVLETQTAWNIRPHFTI